MRKVEAIYPDWNEPLLLSARAKMAEALTLLDQYSRSAAAANLDLALYHLDRELRALHSAI